LVEPPSPCESVSTIMSTKVVKVNANEKVGKALQMMVRDKIGSIVVIEKGKPVGILTERDVSMRVAKGQNVRGMTIRNVMSKPLFTIAPSAEVWQAVEQMVRKDIVRLPVVDGGRLVGMVTERDIFRWMIKIAYEPNLPNDLMELVKSRAQAHALAH
jgi:CBS domain-containing protein